MVVTGAARGMGRACAWAFAREGAAVALLDQSENALADAADKLKSEGLKAMRVACDVSNSESVNDAVGAVLAQHGTVDVLVNNAGVLRQTTPAHDIPDDEWDLVVNVNLKGVFLMSRAVLPLMRKKRSGKVINISSSAGRSTSELGGAHYTASKAGVLGLTRHLAREYGPYGVNVNAICPGLVETPMIREQASGEKLAHWLGQIPLGRFAEPEEEADLALFLASDQARYITGATIDLNGGSLLM